MVFACVRVVWSELASEIFVSSNGHRGRVKSAHALTLRGYHSAHANTPIAVE